MSHPDFIFEIGQLVRVDADFHKHRATVTCKTEDGKSIHLNADFKTLEKIHDEIRKNLENL